jgi:hypothetical protein
MGMAVVYYSPSPVLGVVLAFISHFMVDMLPHWNWRPDTRPLSLLGIGLDLILAEILTLYIFRLSGGDGAIILGALAAILPDLLEAPAIFLGYKNRWVDQLTKIQVGLQNNVEIIPGIISQILLSAVCLLLLIR